jgi:CBS domain-containing protein
MNGTGNTTADQQAQREAAQSTIRHVGPTADRYALALERYVSAVSANAVTEPRSADSAHHFPPMTVADVMTRDVVCAYPGAQFKEIAQALHRNGINAVPVIDEDRHVVGVVTASDLLARVGRTRPLPRGHRPGHQDKRHKVHAATARDLMTSPAITTTPGTSIADAARLFGRHRVRSLPVVDRHGSLVAMLSRADLIELFLRSDEDIRHDVERDVVHKSTEPANANVQVSVEEGVVTLSGRVASALTARGVAFRAADVPGVVDVRDELEFEVNDLYVPTRHPS